MTTRKMTINYKWTTREDETLLTLTKEGLSYVEIAARLNRSVWATRKRANRIGVRTKSWKRWTKEEIAYLKQALKEEVFVRDIAQALGRPHKNVQWKIEHLGLQVRTRPGVNGKPSRFWTRQEELFLYTSMEDRVTLARAGELIQRSRKTVHNKMRRMGHSWMQGYTSASDLAREFGFKTVKPVQRLIRNLIWPGSEKPWTGEGTGRRYKLDCDQADRIRSILERKRRMRK